jgi:hypothetical protein
MGELKVPEFIQDYMNEIHNQSATHEFVALAKAYHDAADNKKNTIGAKMHNAQMWEKLKNEKIDVNLQKELNDLEKDYKAKAKEIARPHVEPAKLEEISQKHQAPPDKTLGEKTTETSQHIDSKQNSMAGAIDTHKTKDMTAAQQAKRQEFLAQMKQATQKNKNHEKERD